MKPLESWDRKAEQWEHRDWCTVCDRYSIHLQGTERQENVTTLFGPPTRVRVIRCTHCNWPTRLYSQT